MDIKIAEKISYMTILHFMYINKNQVSYIATVHIRYTGIYVASYIYAKQKHLWCKKGEANQKQQLSDYKYTHSYTCN